MKSFLLLTIGIVHALQVEKAITQLSAFVEGSLKYTPYKSEFRHKFDTVAPKVIMHHYLKFLQLEHPTKNDIFGAIHETTLDLQLKFLKSNSLLKRDLIPDANQLAMEIEEQRRILLKSNDKYVETGRMDEALQNMALKQQLLDFINGFDPEDQELWKGSAESEPFRELLWDIIDVKLEKDLLEDSIVGQDEKIQNMRQQLYDIESGHPYLRREEHDKLVAARRHVSSAKILLDGAYHGIGIPKKAWKKLERISSRMNNMLIKNAIYKSEERRQVAKELAEIMQNSPVPSKIPVLIMTTLVIGIAGPSILYSIFNSN